jgi:hypothetical protein
VYAQFNNKDALFFSVPDELSPLRAPLARRPVLTLAGHDRCVAHHPNQPGARRASWLVVPHVYASTAAVLGAHHFPNQTKTRTLESP